jgi:hypothetical protein
MLLRWSRSLQRTVIAALSRKARTLFGLERAERRLLLQALGRVGLVRIGLWLLPFPSVQSLVERTGSLKPQRDSVVDPDRAARAIVGASRSIPRATCLTQAIAGRWLLAAYGYPSRMQIGAARDAEGHLELHAWLECDGRIVLGGQEYAIYQALPEVFKR